MTQKSKTSPGKSSLATTKSAYSPIEISETNSGTVMCDGGSGALGHPAVYLNAAKAGKIVCPYCSKCFVFKGSAATAH